MIQFRRIAALVLGLWLGAGIFADFAVTRNFHQVEGFLSDPGSVTTGVEMNRIGRWKERIIIRRYVGELNNSIFETWEWTELFLGTVLLLLLFFERPDKWMLAAPVAMLIIVAAQRFYLSPQVADMGRKLADLPAKNSLTATFWMFHGIYSGVEILKLLIGGALALRLSYKGKTDPNYFVKQFAGRKGAKRSGEAA